jgi:hypothetical protein
MTIHPPTSSLYLLVLHRLTRPSSFRQTVFFLENNGEQGILEEAFYDNEKMADGET